MVLYWVWVWAVEDEVGDEISERPRKAHLHTNSVSTIPCCPKSSQSRSL